MGKIKFILEELLRSFQQSLIRNILLMIMFSICLLMTVIMSSYYLNLGEANEYDISNYDKEGRWYYMMLSPDERNDFDNNLLISKTSLEVMDYYNRIRNIDNHPVMSVNTYQYSLFSGDVVKALFGNKDYRAFQPDEAEGSFEATIEGITSDYSSIKTIWLDTKAYNYFGLSTSEGDDLNDDNTTLNNVDDCIPIVVGADYKDYVHIGQQLQIARDGTGFMYKCKVVGILNKAAKMLDFGAVGQDMLHLDSYIIFPFDIKLSYETNDNEIIARYALLNSRALWDARIFLRNDNEFRKVTEKIGQISRECHMPTLELYGASMGLNLLQNESAEQVRVMLLITVLLVAFTLFALFMTFYNKIQDNRYVYGVYMLNGCSAWLMIIPYILEIGSILLPSLVLGRCVFNGNVLGVEVGDSIINTMYCMVLGAFLIVAVYLAIIIHKNDVEHMMKCNTE